MHAWPSCWQAAQHCTKFTLLQCLVSCLQLREYKGRPRWKIFCVKSLTARGTDCSAWSISASWPSCCQNFCVSSWSRGTLSWDDLRKVARAVNSQPNQQSKLAAIVAIKEKTSSSIPLESIPHLREDCIWGGYNPKIWLLMCKQRIFFSVH